MPTYEYQCKNCGERFEVFQSFSARPVKTHDSCGGEVQKVFHARGVVFKGSGFYATDSRSKSSASTAGASSKSDSKAESKAGTSSESKTSTTTKPASDD